MGKYLEFKNVKKSFPGVMALKGVSFRAEEGRVLALLGENGAGKSTLLKVMAGDYKPEEGEVIVSGETMHFTSPHDAIAAGISVIYQERQTVPELSVAENVYAGDLPLTKMGFIDKKKLYKDTQDIIEKFHLDIHPGDQVGRLSVAYQQMVEIMKAYRRDSQIIAFDEPTSSLADAEVETLFDLIRQLRDEGKVILYVSHRMAEIFEICDDIVVFKDGAFVTTFDAHQVSENELINAMVGRDVGDAFSKLSRNDQFGDVVLEVKGLRNNRVHDVSFQVRAGEIVGFSGLVGAGRTETMRAVFAADKIQAGEIFLNGQKVVFKSPKQAIDAGVAFCPEDRKEQGLFLHNPVRDNISVPILKKIKNGLFLNRKIESDLAEAEKAEYDIKTPSIEKLVVELSGGNQQKVILARWTNDMIPIKLLILDEPTKGIDVGTRAEIYQRICNYAKKGIAVIYISSELPEVIGISDRLYVMCDGRITGELSREEATEEAVLSLAMVEENGGEQND